LVRKQAPYPIVDVEFNPLHTKGSFSCHVKEHINPLHTGCSVYQSQWFLALFTKPSRCYPVAKTKQVLSIRQCLLGLVKYLRMNISKMLVGMTGKAAFSVQGVKYIHSCFQLAKRVLSNRQHLLGLVTDSRTTDLGVLIIQYGRG
jgi:hypothetical protein